MFSIELSHRLAKISWGSSQYQLVRRISLLFRATGHFLQLKKTYSTISTLMSDASQVLHRVACMCCIRRLRERWRGYIIELRPIHGNMLHDLRLFHATFVA